MFQSLRVCKWQDWVLDLTAWIQSQTSTVSTFIYVTNTCWLFTLILHLTVLKNFHWIILLIFNFMWPLSMFLLNIDLSAFYKFSSSLSVTLSLLLKSKLKMTSTFPGFVLAWIWFVLIMWAVNSQMGYLTFSVFLFPFLPPPLCLSDSAFPINKS